MSLLGTEAIARPVKFGSTVGRRADVSQSMPQAAAGMQSFGLRCLTLENLANESRSWYYAS